MHNIVKDIPLWSVTTWDKNFSGVDRNWQPRTIKYKYLLSDELDQINIGGDVCLLYTGKDIGYTNEHLAGDALCEGEIVSIPWGGTPSVKYYKGKFVTGDNRIATSSKPEELLNKFLYYYLKGHLREISSYYRGAGLKHPSMKDVLKMSISYPNIETQKRIIAQFEHLEHVISLREEEINRFDDLIKARFVEMFGDENNSKNWDLVRIEEVADVQVGVVIKPAQYYTDKDNGIKAFRSLNVGEGYIKDSDWVYFSQEGHLKNSKSILKENDLLIVRSGAPGTACVVPKEYAGCNAIDIIIAHPDCERVNTHYLCAFTNMPHGKRQIDEGTGGAAQQHFNVGKYNKMVLMLPPLKLQNDFEDYIKQVDKSKVVVQKTLDEAQLLFDSLMQQYFG